MDKGKTGKTWDSKLCKYMYCPVSVCSTQISSCNYRDVPSKGERPLSAESHEDGLPTLVGGVITVWEDTHTKNNMKSTEWGFTFKDIHRKKTYFSLNVLHVVFG